MSGDSTSTEATGSTFDQALAMFVVVFSAAIGGILVHLLKGVNIGENCCCKTGFKIRSVSEKITIPPLVGMIVMGCVARNFFGSFMDHLNGDWSEWVRMVCLSVILLRGGLELDFEGKGLTVVLLTLCP